MFREAGFESVDFEERADVYVINTCTVTNTADNKSAKVIRHAIKTNPDAIILVCGCFPQVNVDKVKSIEGISIIIGNKYNWK